MTSFREWTRTERIVLWVLVAMIVVSTIAFIVLATTGHFTGTENIKEPVTFYNCDIYTGSDAILQEAIIDIDVLQQEVNIDASRIGVCAAATPDGKLMLQQGISDASVQKSLISEYDVNIHLLADSTSVFTADYYPHLSQFVCNDVYLFCIGADTTLNQPHYLLRVKRTAEGHFFKNNTADNVHVLTLADVLGDDYVDAVPLYLETDNLVPGAVFLGIALNKIVEPNPEPLYGMVTRIDTNNIDSLDVIAIGKFTENLGALVPLATGENKIAVMQCAEILPLTGIRNITVGIYARNNANELFQQTQVLFEDVPISFCNSVDTNKNCIAVYDQIAHTIYTAVLNGSNDMFEVNQSTIDVKPSPYFALKMVVTLDNTLLVLDMHQLHVYSYLTGTIIKSIDIGMDLNDVIMNTGFAPATSKPQCVIAPADGVTAPFQQVILPVSYPLSPVGVRLFSVLVRTPLRLVTL